MFGPGGIFYYDGIFTRIPKFIENDPSIPAADKRAMKVWGTGPMITSTHCHQLLRLNRV
jgi:hypothetical protein